MDKLFLILLVSMLPVVELRGALPIAAGMGLPEIPSLLVAMIGNLMLMPFVFIYAQRFLEWGSHKKYLSKFCNWLIKKGRRCGEKLHAKKSSSIYLALILFVGIPIPGTGAWTGTIAASFLDLDFKKSIASITCGVLLAGLIIFSLSFGTVNMLF